MALVTYFYHDYSERLLIKEKEELFFYLELCYQTTDMKKAKELLQNEQPCTALAHNTQA